MLFCHARGVKDPEGLIKCIVDISGCYLLHYQMDNSNAISHLDLLDNLLPQHSFVNKTHMFWSPN